MNIGIIGHFADGKEIYDGQTVKTRNIYEALKNDYNPIKLDTYEWKNKKIDTFINCIKMLKNNKNIIILTAQRGLFVFIPLFALLNVFFKKKIHYVVVGAWLEEKIKNNKFMIWCLRHINYIYVENSNLKNKLNYLSINNVYIMRNFKNITPVKKVTKVGEKVKLCFFARVMEKKGIEDAIRCVSELEKNVIFDIYGPIDKNYEEKFCEIKKNFSNNISYKGIIDSNKSVDTLKNYDIMLFPTKFKTEGIPGTIIDAYASGLTVVSSIWDNYNEIIDDGITGIGYEIDNYNDFKKKITELIENKNKIYELKKNALRKFKCFSSDEIEILKNNM